MSMSEYLANSLATTANGLGNAAPLLRHCCATAAPLLHYCCATAALHGKKRFCYTNKIIRENRDNKNILLQQQNVWFYQQNVWLLRQNFGLQQDGEKGFVIPTKSFVKIGLTKIFCCNNKMFSSINKTFGCCSKIFGNKKFICCP